MFASNGILFNHESPLRGETFVTKKITKALSRIFMGKQDLLYIGNLDSKRDWGHAKDYVYAQWLILQQREPMDIVISSGKQYSVRYFIEKCCEYLNWKIYWHGKGVKEYGYVLKNNQKIKIVQVSQKYFRPNELHSLKGNSQIAKKKLKFKTKYNIKKLISEMMAYDIKNLS